ncbi:oligosaccharide flippase family protein [Empedobacter falsenii]
MEKLKKIFSNKIIWYLITRYLTYFIQFLSSIIIAVKLGPYLFGIWGFILLLLNYFRIIDFGISNASNILIVQNKENVEKVNAISWNAIYLVTGLNLLIVLFALYYKIIGIQFFDKFDIDKFFVMIIIVAMMTNYNVLLMNLYRIQNSLKELTFYQSSIPIIIFALAFILKGEILLDYLLYANVVGNIICLIVFYLGKKIPRFVSFDKKVSLSLLNKGIYLFIYNISFYLIVLSIKTLISIYYTVEEFGIFSFSHTLGNSVLLFLQALTFIVFPKIVSKLKGEDYIQIRKTINDIRKSYVTLAFGLVYLFLSISPFLLNLIPKYKEAFVTLALVNLTIVLYTNSFGYGSFLMAQNKEKLNALISFISLLINLLIAFILIKVVHVSYNYVIMATIIAYVLYTFLCVYFGKKKMGLKEGFIKDFDDCFPFRLAVPYILAIVIVVTGYKYLMVIPFIIFVLLNIKPISEIMDKIKLLILKPNVIDL